MNAPGERSLRVGHGVFDPLSGELSLDGRRSTLRPRTAALLAYLLRHPDRVAGKDELMAAIWPDAVVTEDSLVQCVKEIRHALGDGGRDWIRTHPRQGYAFVGPVCDAAPPPVPRSTQRPGWRGPAAAAGALMVATAALLAWQQSARTQAPVSPSVLVLPVLNATGDPGRENTADEITEALTDTIGGMAGTRVISAGTAFTFKGAHVDVRELGAQLKVHYVLQGSLRIQHERPLLSMRLTDTATAVQLWSGEFPLQGNGLPELRDDALDGMASTLGVQLLRARAHSTGQPATADAAEKPSRARSLLRSSGGGARAVEEASELLEQAVRADPGIALAWVLLANTHIWQVRFSGQREAHLARAAEALRRADALAPDGEAVQVAHGGLLYEQGRMPEALRAFDRALEANPSNAMALGKRGAALVMLGRPQEALVAIDEAMRLSPRDFRMKDWQIYAGVAHLHLGHSEQSVELLVGAVEAAPENAFARLFLASALGAADRVDEARAQMAQFQRLYPGFTLARFQAVEPSDTPAFRQQRQRVYEGLRRAGMPE